MKNLKDIVNDFIGKYVDGESYYSVRGVVKDVDEEGNTCTVTARKTGQDIKKVQLSSYIGATLGVNPLPTVGSLVTVAYYSRNEAYVTKFSEVSSINIIYINEDDRFQVCFENGSCFLVTQPEIKFNDGSLGGLIPVQELTNKLNNLVNEVTAMNTFLKTHEHPTAATGIPSPPTPPYPDSPSVFDREDYENTDINHGSL